ncbi:Hypothetical predicted protein [Paramuricea clavata]|uniref:Uncharacterized protein n=1 Tax=Paramuricea clavata TaxID=317549 RepID=A0A6S7JU95_PARCT|nr:Hypothetical predicted protein [Paramuricea clavata]
MSARKVTAGLCILWQCFHLSSCSIAHMKYSKLKAINWGLPLAGHKFNVTPIATSRVTNHIKCMVHCAETEGCVAINLGPAQAGEHECEMLETTRYSIFNAKFTAKAGWKYVGPMTKCDVSPCRKGFWCIAHEEYEIGYTCLDPVREPCTPLGMESGKILDGAITASTSYNSELGPANARLNVHRGWCAWTTNNAGKQSGWIQVDLGDIIWVTGVATQGRCVHPQWVKSYKVSYSTDGQNWEFYDESGSTKIFTGNTDKTTVVTNAFKSPIHARYVKILPQSFVDRPSLRMELYTSCTTN